MTPADGQEWKHAKGAMEDLDVILTVRDHGNMTR